MGGKQRFRLFGVDVDTVLGCSCSGCCPGVVLEEEQIGLFRPPQQNIKPKRKPSFRLFGVNIHNKKKIKPAVVSSGGSRAKKATQPAKIPDLANQKIQNLGGNDTLLFLTDKIIETSDVRKSQNRLMIPNRGIEKLINFMTLDEKQILGIVDDKITRTNKNKGEEEEEEEEEEDNGDDSNSHSKIEIKVVDGNGETYNFDMKIWPSVGKLALIKGWYKLVLRNKMEKDDSIGLWCFRDGDSNLCFAVVKIEKAQDQDNGGPITSKKDEEEEEGKAQAQDNGGASTSH